jgi:hypothetical protein
MVQCCGYRTGQGYIYVEAFGPQFSFHLLG